MEKSSINVTNAGDGGVAIMGIKGKDALVAIMDFLNGKEPLLITEVTEPIYFEQAYKC